MKYKSIGAIACIAILLVGSLNWNLLFGLTTEKRVHQHLSYVPKQKCEQTHNDGELCTHLPLISIDTNGQEIPGKGMKDENGKYSLKWFTYISGKQYVTDTKNS